MVGGGKGWPVVGAGVVGLGVCVGGVKFRVRGGGGEKTRAAYRGGKKKNGRAGKHAVGMNKAGVRSWPGCGDGENSGILLTTTGGKER